MIIPDFIIVDNDSQSALSAKRIINITYPTAAVLIFSRLQSVEEFLQSSRTNLVIFLNVNMNNGAGWKFLENMRKIGRTLNSRIKLYLLSEPLTEGEKDRAWDNPLVHNCIEKPLSHWKIATLEIDESVKTQWYT
ncbi:MAG TPA: hypothetical protein VEC12_06405 [Bacteroidia bacterium]|nr:hypothetical protein [Bacteroidia bacterium]